MEKCFLCGRKRLYRLQRGYYRCSGCGKKYSGKKVALDTAVLQGFLRRESVQECARNLGHHYGGVQKRYALLRRLLVNFLHAEHEKSGGRALEFDEYVYLKADSLKRWQNFLSFDYGYIYNVMLPSLAQKYHIASQRDLRELKTFLLLHRIAKLQKRENRITRFWHFFENHMLRYRGVDSDKFIFYLKEAEFFFNYESKRRQEIATELYFRGLYA